MNPSNYEEFKKHDVMRITSFLCVDIMDYKIVQFLAYFTLIFKALCCLVQAYFFITEFNREYLIMYAPFFFLSLYVVITGYHYLTKRRYFVEYVHKCYDINGQIYRFNINTNKKFKLQIRIITIYTIFNLIFAFINSLTYIIPMQDEHEYVFIVALGKKLRPELEFWFIVLFRISIAMVPLLFLSVFHGFIYSTSSLRFLSYFMTKELIENVTPNEEVEELMLYYDKNYQQQIKEAVKKVVMFHERIKAAADKMNQEMTGMVIIIPVITTVLAVSLLFFMLTYRKLSAYLRIIPTFAIGTVCLMGVAIAGQLVEDQSENVEHQFLLDMNWYIYNLENRRSALIVYMVLQKTIKIKFGQTMSVNLETALLVVKSIYSLLSIVLQLVDFDII